MRIALIGFMGVGKTTVGRELSTVLSFPFIDLDEEIERREGRSVEEIFAAGGEEAFRAAEATTLRAVVASAPADLVLALGGGTILREENRAVLSDYTIIYIKAEAPALAARLSGSPRRPLLENHSLGQLLAEREAIYSSSADITIKNDGLDAVETVRKIAEAISL